MSDGYQREKTALVGDDTYLTGIFEAVVHPADFDSRTGDEVADFLTSLVVRVRSGALHGYKKRLVADLTDPQWQDAIWQTARKGVAVRDKATGREGKIVGARAANAIFVRWADDTSGGMGDRVPIQSLRVRV